LKKNQKEKNFMLKGSLDKTRQQKKNPVAEISAKKKK